MKEIVRIGNAQGFWGDSPGAAARMVHLEPELDYLTLDYLAELSLSIMASQREKDPQLGYARDFVDVIHSLIPYWNQGSPVKIVTNAGGLNPLGCAQECAKVLQQGKARPLKIGIVDGDNVLDILKNDPRNVDYLNFETHESLDNIVDKLTTANAYFGASQIVQALQEGADIVITGRVADPSLTVGPCAAHFGWSWNDFDALAGATVAGHLIECGNQVTGGMSTDWMTVFDPVNMGYPIVEVKADGSCIVTKPGYTGGRVTEETVKEQLLYEIGDPGMYLSPDVTVSFLTLKVEVEGKDRVRVSGATGKPPPSTLKVSTSYRNGYKTEGMLTVFGPDAQTKARKIGEIIVEKVRHAGFALHRTLIECLGCNDSVGGVVPLASAPKECVLRIAVADPRKEALEIFVKEIAPMVTSGPQGVVGYASGRPKIRPVFGYWPCLINRDLVKPNVQWIQT